LVAFVRVSEASDGRGGAKRAGEAFGLENISVTHTNWPLDQATDAYEHFDSRENGWTKVVLKPAAKQQARRSAAKHAVASHS
jgi:hypothetical protein